MAAIDKNKLDKFLSVALGLNFCVSGLQDFILDTMETTHKNILQQIPAGFCTINCSRKYGNGFSQWCNICRAWKDELHKFCQYKKQWDKINWKEIDTIDFPHSTPDSYEAISKVFVRDARQFRQGIYQDLGAIISLFMNMRAFSIDKRIMAEVLRHRNDSFAHNYKLSVEETEKKMCLQSFIRILRGRNIYCKESAKVAVGLLEELVSSEGIPTYLLQQQAARETLILVRDGIDQFSPSTDLQIVAFVSARDRFKDRINNIILKSTIKPKRVITNLISPKTRNVLKYLSLPIFLLYITISFISLQKMNSSNEGCFSMRFSEHWKSDLDFDFYVKKLNNESFIERRWLKDIIDKQLLVANGVLLTAQMGYGKSSIISNIVCANRLSVWYDFRKHILAYHFCRYDTDMSVSAGTFIRNLASAIVKLYPEMGNAILADEVASDFLYGTRCYKDPISCFEMSILNPLRDHWINENFIILIDALDECDTAGRNTLFYFLLTQIQRFPTNFKFVLTSRKIESINRNFQFLDEKVRQVYLNTSNSFNLNDVKQYVRKTSKLTEHQISTLTRAADGNFLHVKLYLQYCKKTDTFDLRNVPNSLALLYQLNFNRIFKDSESLFYDFLPVFEVLCTIQNPIDREQLIEVSQIEGTSKIRQLETLLGNELGHFLKFEDGKMSFFHKSIIDFLTDERRNKLRIFVHKDNGHKLFAEYLLGQLKMNLTLKHNLIELIHHVAMSKNAKYESMLFDYVRDLLTKDDKLHLELLYQVVWKYNDYHTTELLLEYIGVAAINTINAMNQSPAFIAASQGNEKTLKCLLKNGANTSFSVVYDYPSIEGTIYVGDEDTQLYTYVSTNHDIVKLCKYIYFCGYNVFHIAAQNGNRYVAEMLIHQYSNLIYSETEMHLNAFHLAVENGHLEIVKLLLNYNKSFADTHSLYKASEKGHEQILKLLLENGSKDECLPCNGTLYWIPWLSNRQQQSIKFDKVRSGLTFNQDVDFQTFFFDDWRLITCETALNTAVRNGHLEIVKTLLRETFTAINCTTFDGKTPLMTAVRYNRSDIFYFLYLNGGNISQKCVHAFNIMSLRSYLDLSEFLSLTGEQCPVGATVAHVIAMHGNFDMMKFMYNNGFSDWEQRDVDQATPLHYAFCHFNYLFIAFNYVKKLNLNFSASTVNGSSVFHSAAICRSFTLYFFHNRNDVYHLIIPDSYDYRNRSILHYSMLLPLRQNYDDLKAGVSEDVLVWSIFQVCLNTKHNFKHTDNEGKNFLHYAAKSGNYFGFKNAYHYLSRHDVMSILTQKDITEKTPVDEIFHAMQKSKTVEFIRIPEGCSIKDVFYTKCLTKFVTILTNHEMCLLQTLMYLSEEKEFANFNVSKFLSIAISKSRIYPILMLKVYAKQQFQDIIENNPPLLQFITEYKGPDIAEFFLTTDNYLKCDGTFSPLHEIIMNDRNTQSMYYNPAILHTYLADYSSTMLGKCYDKDGYNLLHRAVMGGNLLGTQFLVNKGMNLLHLSRHGQSALQMLIDKAPFLDNGVIPLHHNEISPYQVLQIVSENRTEELLIDYRRALQYDETAMFLLENIHTSRLSRQRKIRARLCRPNEFHLSLVHLAAAKGFIGFLKKCVLLFDSDILKCYDFNKITPYYLTKIYKQARIIKWMDSIRIPPTKPNLKIESLLVYNMLFNYKRSSSFDWICRLHYSYKHHGLIQTQISRCKRARRNEDNFILYKNVLKDVNLQVLQSVLSSMSTSNIHPNMGFCECVDTIHLCSGLVETNNVIIRHLKLLQKQAYTHLRKFMMFDDHDHMFLYRRALRNIFNEPEQKYFRELSLNSIVSPRFRYLQQLRQRHSIHNIWLAHFTKGLEKRKEISSSVYSKFEYKLVSWLNLNTILPGTLQQFIEKIKRYEMKMEAFKKNKNNVCHHCENIKATIEDFTEICSMGDVFSLEMECIEGMKDTKYYHNDMQFPTEDFEWTVRNDIDCLEREARKNPFLLQKVIFFQKNMSLLLYFMQFIPNERKSSICMRFLVTNAIYAEKMDL